MKSPRRSSSRTEDVMATRENDTRKRGRPAKVITSEGAPGAKKRNTKNGSTSDAVVGFEEKLWQMADKLRNNMDAAEYKHVVLGLIFLKNISDAFEEKYAALTADKKSGADPEDPDEYRVENIFWVPKEARWSHLQANAKQAIIGKLIERDNPFAPAATAAPTPSTSASLSEALTALNAIIDKHNETSAQFKASVDEASKKLEDSYVAEAHAEFVQLSEAVTTANTALENIKAKPAGIQTQIDELERAILQHRRPADELTAELRAYLGRDELRFEVKGTGYALTRSGQPVSHLSEGERTAITFLYFLKSLQDKTFDLKNGIVVIDDPVSSLDANALFSAFGYMKERTKQAGQLFIFTHSFQFFRNVKNWLVYVNGGPKSKKRPDKCDARFFPSPVAAPH